MRNMRVVGHKHQPAWADKVSVGESSCTCLFVNTLLGASSTCFTSCKHSVSCSTSKRLPYCKPALPVMLVQYISVLSEVLHSTGQSKGQITQVVPVLAFVSSAASIWFCCIEGHCLWHYRLQPQYPRLIKA